MYDNDDSDGLVPQSPKLQAIKVRPTPSPSPPPFIPKKPHRSSPEAIRPHSSRRRRSRRGRTQASLGDAVLVGLMGPNHPDIARKAGETALQPLDSASQSETSDGEGEMEGRTFHSIAATAPASDGVISHELPLEQVAKAALAASKIAEQIKTSHIDIKNTSLPSPGGPAFDHLYKCGRDSQGANVKSDAVREVTSTLHAEHSAGAAPAQSGGTDASQPIDIPKPSKREFTKTDTEIPKHASNGYSYEDSMATSPNLREHLAKGSPAQTLPALQNPTPQSQDDPTSPSQERSLPPFRHLSELAEAATNEQERVNNFHRQSFSSTGGPPSHSPTIVNRRFTNGQQWSPPSQFPSLSHASPVSAHSDTSPHDICMSGLSPPRRQSYYPRRQSHASENGRTYPPPLHSASTTGSYASTDGCSPGTQPTPIEHHRMSTDDPSLRVLPPPHVSIQHVPPHGLGGFKCEFPGCNAAPFQTQYLLK